MPSIYQKEMCLVYTIEREHLPRMIGQRQTTTNKQIILTNFPQPEIISISPELEFYDIQNGMFNSFSPDDLTTLNNEAKNHIREKIPQSGLIETAKKEALQAVLIMESIVATIGWKLDYSALEIAETEKKELLEE